MLAFKMSIHSVNKRIPRAICICDRCKWDSRLYNVYSW